MWESDLEAIKKLPVKPNCFVFGEHATPLQMAVAHLKDVPATFTFFEMDARTFFLNPLTNSWCVDLPNVRSSAAEREVISAREDFFHILDTAHLYDPNDTVPIAIIQDFGAQNGANFFRMTISHGPSLIAQRTCLLS